MIYWNLTLNWWFCFISLLYVHYMTFFYRINIYLSIYLTGKNKRRSLIAFKIRGWDKFWIQITMILGNRRGLINLGRHRIDKVTMKVTYRVFMTVGMSPGSLVQDDVPDIDSRSQISRCSDCDNDSVLSLSQSAARGNADFQNFMKKVADPLHVDVEHIGSDTSEFKSYVSDRLVARSKKSPRSGLPMDDAILSALSEVNQEFQKRGSVSNQQTMIAV